MRETKHIFMIEFISMNQLLGEQASGLVALLFERDRHLAVLTAQCAYFEVFEQLSF